MTNLYVYRMMVQQYKKNLNLDENDNININTNINPNVNKDLKNFLGGTIGGVIGTFLSHPFDTIKNRIQTNNPYSIYNLRDLYKGLSVPLFGIALEKTIVFGTYNTSKKYISTQTNNEIASSTISGFIAGICCTGIVTPVEKIKINLQNSNPIVYTNLYKGWTATLTREVPGYSIYFLTYEMIKKYVYTNNNMSMSMFDNFIIGGLCGLSSWIFIYPQDKIKTIIQNTSTDKKILNVYREIKLNEGFRGFYRGFSLCLMRAIPLHAGVFLGNDIVQKYF
jgi:solute carrier family 25 carnitine/acylcarnitine transporter 20/29